jgi:FO synthase
MGTTHRLTFSRSITFTLTHDCPWHCQYCGFRTDSEGLLPDRELTRLSQQIKHYSIDEALLISGERPGSMAHIRTELNQRGFADFIDFAIHVAQTALAAGALPHGNFGALTESDLARLRPWHVSMGLMLENIHDYPWAPQKKAKARLNTLMAAGKLKIPFTSGLLLGMGESRTSRFESLEALADLHLRYGHLQEILLQNFVPNHRSPLQFIPEPLTVNDFAELILFWKDRCPDVPVQIPPNLTPFWPELIPLASDLGGISFARDEVNQDHPWQTEETYRQTAQSAGAVLEPRLAIYDRFIDPTWLDPALLAKVKTAQEKLTKVSF